MPYLDTYSLPLTAKTVAHLLRRATFGPTQQEVIDFTGLTATQLVQSLIGNADFSVPEPVDLDSTSPTAGQAYLNIIPYNWDRVFWFRFYIKQWWIGLMGRQAPVTILDKMTLFWQNHFVASSIQVDEYRFEYQYIKLIRQNALGNFRYLVTQITKEPAMLKFLNGNDNVKGAPNENYARELQELFTVGEKNFNGNPNYSEEDVREAARVLTGWKYLFELNSFGTTFDPNDHDETDKQFSTHYNNTRIQGRSGESAGSSELDDLITMLLNHPETPKFICRKLYRWFVNPTVTEEVEINIIVPLAQFFSSPLNDYAIAPVVQKLLTSQHFFEDSNIGAMIKSPADLIFGTLRFFNFPIPPIISGDVQSFYNLTHFIYYRLSEMQMEIMTQPSVFGYEPYFQTGYSKIWINSTSLAQRGAFTDALIWGWFNVNTNYTLGLDFFALAASANDPYNPLSIVERFTKNLFSYELNSTQKVFLVDTILMMGLQSGAWSHEYDDYIKNPLDLEKSGLIKWRLQTLMRYLLRMAEYQIC